MGGIQKTQVFRQAESRGFAARIGGSAAIASRATIFRQLRRLGAHICFFPEILAVTINNMSRIFKQRYYQVESTLRSGLAQKVSYISEQ